MGELRRYKWKWRKESFPQEGEEKRVGERASREQEKKCELETEEREREQEKKWRRERAGEEMRVGNGGEKKSELEMKEREQNKLQGGHYYGTT